MISSFKLKITWGQFNKDTSFVCEGKTNINSDLKHWIISVVPNHCSGYHRYSLSAQVLPSTQIYSFFFFFTCGPNWNQACIHVQATFLIPLAYYLLQPQHIPWNGNFATHSCTRANKFIVKSMPSCFLMCWSSISYDQLALFVMMTEIQTIEGGQKRREGTKLKKKNF